MHKAALTFLFVLVAAPAAADDFLDGVAQRSCACLKALEPQADREQYTAQAGLCMFKSFTAADREAIKEEYGVDLSDPARYGRRAGELVGARMAMFCGDEVLKLAGQVKAPPQVVKGVVVRIEDAGFVVLTVKDGEGSMVKLYWLKQVISNRDLPNGYRKLEGARVEASFEPTELFDPKIGEYRSYRVLKSLSVESGGRGKDGGDDSL
ncbi:MAG: hypothetical protein QM767_27340 [Anaeromyxobacter sp.]